jgi:integrase
LRPTSTQRSAICRYPTSRPPTSSPSWSRFGSTRPKPPGAYCNAWSWCSSRRSCLGNAKKASPCVGIRQTLGIRHVNVEHLRALPYADVPAFLNALRLCNSEQITKLAFEWLILTATRSGETRGARWEEIDERQALWTIPKERMKGRRTKRREHVVPLPECCLEILREARALNPRSDLLFPGPRTGQELSDMTLTKVLRDLGIAERATVHGFRSSFRDWATESDKVREVVAEAALAHTVDKTESAYRRTTYLEERTGLMKRWANYCELSTECRNPLKR